MAGSRLDRIGTIFSRTTGLLKAGAIKYPDRPLWYDIYRVFPPKYEPHIDRESEKKDIMEIFYKEDKFRALFFKKFGRNPGGTARNLGDRNFEEPAQPFVSSCLELLKTHPDWDDQKVFEAAAEKYGSTRPFDVKDVVTHQQQQWDIDAADAMEESKAAKRHGRKPPTITAQSLLSLFNEAKEKQEKSTSAEGKQPSSDSKPPRDENK